MSKRVSIGVATAVTAVALAAVAGAGATSPPIGALPPGPTATFVTQSGELVAVALPHRSGGRVWRIARKLNTAVLNQVSEADVGSNVVLVFKTKHAGNATLSFALTRGETSKALESRIFKVRVR